FDVDLQQTILQSTQPPAGEVLLPPAGSAVAASTSRGGRARESGGSLAGILPLPPGSGPAPWGAGTLAGRTAPGNPARAAGLYGTPHELRLDLCRIVPSRRSVARARGVTSAAALELRTVFYALARPLPAERSLPGAPTHSGEALIRYETGWLESPAAPAVAQPAGLPSSSQDQLFEEFLALEDRYEAAQRETSGAALPSLVVEEFSVAPEVAGLEFRYFDGIQWLGSWDSAAAGVLPHAVEIVATLRPVLSQRAARAAELAAERDGALESQYPVSRLVVQLPLGGEPRPADAGATAASDFSAGGPGAAPDDSFAPPRGMP
ncbi:MAG: hypothetical protein JNG90_13765, partial [Planctomycetaceae bacterium]|nr:hypothetical protein [Planctomycetaceae bacterium]